jgi:lipopolysaccharide export system permease protein
MRLKRLYIFSIRSFIGPFFVTLTISMFILVMQFLWKYIDDLMGKGIDTFIILELLFYVSASLIPLALPLAILLSSIMTFGNLSENNELTALKSSGLSLYRIMRPLTVVVFLIAAGTFYFANYVIPVANLKWHSLIYDIQNTKISALLTPGVYSKELEGYAIKVDEGKGDQFKGILIHDHTSPKEIKTVRAEDGKLYKSINGKYLFFELNNGYVVEELSPQSPTFSVNGKLHRNQHNNRPSRRSDFEKATYKIDLSGFTLQRSQDETFADKHEMLNVFQIQEAIDSINQNGQDMVKKFAESAKNEHIYFQALQFKANKLNHDSGIKDTIEQRAYLFDELSSADRKMAIQVAQAKLRRSNQTLQGQMDFLKSFDRDSNSFWIEFHRKFALTYAIIVLFFIGAPLGAIVRKGGFGAPVVIAALLFMVYFVLISIGDSLAASEVVSPFIGMWFASIVLTPIAFIVLRSAANDRPIFDRENWSKLLKKIRKKSNNAI